MKLKINHHTSIIHFLLCTSEEHNIMYAESSSKFIDIDPAPCRSTDCRGPVLVMTFRIPSCGDLLNIWSNSTLFRSLTHMSSTLTPCQELKISCRAPEADHPPLFSLVIEPKGNHISRWIPSLFICTMLITASKKDQSYLNYPPSLQPPEDSSQY